MAVTQRQGPFGENEAPGELELSFSQFVNTLDVEEGTDELDGPDALLGWLSGMGLLDDEAIADEEDLKRALALEKGYAPCSWPTTVKGSNRPTSGSLTA